MRLALRLGRTLGELEESMDARELALWAALDRLEAFSDQRLGPALVAQTIAAAHCKQPPPLHEFLLGSWRESPPGSDSGDGSGAESEKGRRAGLDALFGWLREQARERESRRAARARSRE